MALHQKEVVRSGLVHCSMQYISKNSKQKIIWGIDEPEAFLYGLQKKVAEVLSGIVKTEKQPIILTTHSQHFIQLNDLSSTYRENLEPRTYKRKPGRPTMKQMSAVKTVSDFEKSSLIKQHLGISNNDGWEVLPFNILVERRGKIRNTSKQYSFH